MTVTIEHLKYQRHCCRDYLKTILNMKPSNTPYIYRILMDRNTGSVHLSRNDPNYERCCYLIELFHSSHFKLTNKEKAKMLFSMLHRFNVNAHKLNDNWQDIDGTDYPESSIYGDDYR